MNLTIQKHIRLLLHVLAYLDHLRIVGVWRLDDDSPLLVKVVVEFLGPTRLRLKLLLFLTQLLFPLLLPDLLLRLQRCLHVFETGHAVSRNPSTASSLASV
jgi:hypothetical protein